MTKVKHVNVYNFTYLKKFNFVFFVIIIKYTLLIFLNVSYLNYLE